MKVVTTFGTLELEEGWRRLLVDDIDRFGFDLPRLREALEADRDVELSEEESEKFLLMVELLDAWYGGGMTE